MKERALLTLRKLQVVLDPFYQRLHSNRVIQRNQPSLPSFNHSVRAHFISHQRRDRSTGFAAQHALREPFVDASINRVQGCVWRVNRDAVGSALEEGGLERVGRGQRLESFEDGWVVCNYDGCLG